MVKAGIVWQVFEWESEHGVSLESGSTIACGCKRV